MHALSAVNHARNSVLDIIIRLERGTGMRKDGTKRKRTSGVSVGSESICCFNVWPASVIHRDMRFAMDCDVGCATRGMSKDNWFERLGGSGYTGASS